jgi:hypothetical protein
LYIYQSAQQKILFLRDKDINFITWLCPMMKSHLF